MVEEYPSDLPDWEQPEEEKIPPSLQEKWEKDEKKGIGAGVCPSCRWPYLEDDLSCRHCGRPVEAESGVISRLGNWFLKNPIGVISFLGFILVLAICFIYWF